MCLCSQKKPADSRGWGGIKSKLREERLTVCSVTSQDSVCTLLSRTSSAAAAHLEEREAELELHRLEKKDEPREAATSERWQHFL